METSLLLLVMKIVGVGHLCLSAGSLFIPKLLSWKKAVSTMPRLIRQIFWTYAGYILSTNLFFGILLLVATSDLISGTALATAMSLFMFLYWLARIVIQLTYFDKKGLPEKAVYKFGELALFICFVSFTAVLGWVFITNLIQ